MAKSYSAGTNSKEDGQKGMNLSSNFPSAPLAMKKNESAGHHHPEQKIGGLRRQGNLSKQRDRQVNIIDLILKKHHAKLGEKMQASSKGNNKNMLLVKQPSADIHIDI